MFFENLEEKENVLFLGEGNFSFSASMVKKCDKKQDFSNIYASCFEKESTVVAGGGETIDQTFNKLTVHRKRLNPETIKQTEQSNPIKDENIAYLQSVGCHVLHGVDAEALAQDDRLANLQFCMIVFMFPHVGGKMKINRNRKLVLNVLKSSKMLLTRRGKVIITLCKGQGGTPFEKVERIAGNTWKIVETGHEAGFVLSQVHHFPHQLFQQYHSVGYRDLQKGFNVEDSVVHVLEVSEPEVVVPIEILGNSKSEHSDEENTSLPVSLYPPHYVHHLSFWTSTQLSDDLLGKIINSSVGKYVLRWITIDKYTSDCGRQGQTLELEYCDPVRAMGPSRVMYIQREVLGQSLVRCAGVTLR